MKLVVSIPLMVCLASSFALAQKPTNKPVSDELAAPVKVYSKADLARLEAAVLKAPTDPALRIELATAAGQNGNLDAASANLKEAAALAPTARTSAFFHLYEDVVRRHTAAGAPRSRMRPEELGWAAVCQGLVRHPEFNLY